MSPKLSVIIPAYQRVDGLKRAIKSVLDQIDDTAELIVVDDASQTPIQEILSGAFAAEPQYLRLEENQGAAAARNAGVEASEAEWICFLDSDDAWLEGRFDQLKRQMDKDTDDGLNVWGSAVLRVTRKDQLRYHSVPKRGLDRPLNMGGCRTCPGSTMLLRRTTFEQVGSFDERLRRLEDYDWFIRFFAFGGRMKQDKEALVFIDKAGGAGREAVDFATYTIAVKLMRPPKIVRAYLRLERARAAYHEGDKRGMLGHLFLSRNIYRRMGLQIQPAKSRRVTTAELDRLSLIEDIGHQ